MRQAGRVVAEVKTELMKAIRPGVKTGELDRIAEERIRQLGATPSFKGYTGPGATPFPSTICVSLNDEIVHGIPGDRVIEEGDIVSVDVGAVVGGFHGDSAFTAVAGEPSDEASRLIDATREALEIGIARAKAVDGSETFQRLCRPMPKDLATLWCVNTWAME